MRNCRRSGGGGGRSNGKSFGKKPQVHLIITRELPNNPTPLILRNLDNFPPGAFYSTLPTIRHKRVCFNREALLGDPCFNDIDN